MQRSKWHFYSISSSAWPPSASGTDEAPAAIARTVKIRLLREFESSSSAAAPERRANRRR